MQPRPGFEECFAGHRRAAAFGLEFFDIDAVTGERVGNLVDDARTVLAHDFEKNQRTGGLFRLRSLGMHHHGQPLALQFLQ